MSPKLRRGANALLIAAALFAAPAAFAAPILSSVDAATLPEKKTTPLGLYLTPEDAYRALAADPSIVFIDVRDPIEISFVGHPAGMDANVPLRLATHEFTAGKGGYRMVANENFLAEAEAAIARAGGGKETPVFVICRSGARSASAASILAKAGYVNVWNLIEGFEGDKDKATKQRTVNGWRNAGLPWSYSIPADAAWTAK